MRGRCSFSFSDRAMKQKQQKLCPRCQLLLDTETFGLYLEFMHDTGEKLKVLGRTLSYDDAKRYIHRVVEQNKKRKGVSKREMLAFIESSREFIVKHPEFNKWLYENS